ncbi:MAG: FKBP-type peptidyl-prolyl cis-trans isomerase [Gemmatimonadetes bacterium]|nr:FKBP-type peptidyl-prolyl cis-trans isomerase [Gemmatimonadota bacterium]
MMETRTGPRLGGTLLFLALTAVGGCRDGPTEPQPIEDTVFADALGIDLAQFTRLESGVYIRDVVTGDGEEAGVGSMPVVEIEGWRRDGSILQQRIVFGDEPNETFTLGGGGVIPGFDHAIRGMRVGGIRIAILPAELAYGDAVLVFEIELLELLEPQEGT